MPRYDFRCPAGHVHEHFASADDHGPRPCRTCEAMAARQFPLTHCPPSGVYSYEPNIGDASVFEQRREAIKSGAKVIPKILSDRQRSRMRDEGIDV